MPANTDKRFERDHPYLSQLDVRAKMASRLPAELEPYACPGEVRGYNEDTEEMNKIKKRLKELLNRYKILWKRRWNKRIELERRRKGE